MPVTIEALGIDPTQTFVSRLDLIVAELGQACRNR